MSRLSEGRSADPLLNDDGGYSRGRTNSPYDAIREIQEAARRRHEMRSKSPTITTARSENKKKYAMAGFFLALSLIAFVVQTETAQYIQLQLRWQKAYSMLYITHSSSSLLWFLQLLILKARKPSVPWRLFLKAHFQHLRVTAQMVVSGSTRLSHSQLRSDPRLPILKTIAFLTGALTIAGISWYIAVGLTTPSDLTAIYNCNAFFAYAFSIPLLHEKPRMDKIVSVGIAIAGVLVVAYGDGNSPSDGHEREAANRVAGNVIIGVGSVLYGLYEVLYKKLACPPEGTSSGRSVVFANTIATGIGVFTLFFLWIPIPILHIAGIEKFELPSVQAGWVLSISVLSNVVFSGSFLTLISLTSPVLSSVAGLLSIFLVAATDWLVHGTPITFAALLGGLLIISAFLLLSWATWKEMNEPRIEIDLEDEDD